MELSNNINLLKVLKHYSDTLWVYDSCENKILIYHDTMTPELVDTAQDIDKLWQLYKENYLYDVDTAIWEKYLRKDNLDKVLASDEALKFNIRFKNNRIKMEWHEVFIEKLNEDKLLISSRNIHSDIQNKAIGKAVENEFDYVAYINVENRNYVLYSAPDRNGNPIPPVFYHDYHVILASYNEQYVIEDNPGQLTKCMQIDHVVKELEDKSEYILFAESRSENDEIRYTKLRFCYLDDKKEVLLLTRINITDIKREHLLREQAEQKQKEEQQRLIHYLDHMPIAYCTTKVLLDENDQPKDFVFTYSNYAHAALENTKYGELIGKSFYKFFENVSYKWLYYYYDTAYHGIDHVLNDYSPEVDKHLLIYTYQPEYGYCGCVVQDITEQKKLENELEYNQKQLQTLLKSTADYVFNYNLETQLLQVILGSRMESLSTESPLIHVEDIIEKAYLSEFYQGINKLATSGSEVSFNVKCSIEKNGQKRWYKVSLFDTNNKKGEVIGYMIDVNDIIVQQKRLKKEATLDPLTNILNTKAGRKLVEEKIMHTKPNTYNILFLIDIDNFKTINDTKGHLKGDEVLIHFSQLLKKTFRKEDVYFRLGGDEFVAFINNVKNYHDVIINVMLQFFEDLEKIKIGEEQLGSSVGIFVSNRKLAFNRYYEGADIALYQTKNKGKNAYTIRVDEQND